jgi:two-component system sensor histidine kinase KdpD
MTKTLISTIDAETDRLNRLVGNLLDLSRLQADALTINQQSTDLGDVIAAALINTPHECDVFVDIPDSVPPVAADPGILERAIGNLFENAARYSPPDRPVHIHAGADDGFVEVRIVDQGRGIPRVERDRVFRPFERLDDTPEGAGVGLGLAVARGFLEAMDGDLAIDETPGGGTTMIVTLKVAS